MQLPQDFVHLMHEQYGAATADALCLALQSTDPEVSVRLNRRKVDADSVIRDGRFVGSRLACSPVPWCPGALYLNERPAFTFDPLFHAGAYYVQEASSMYIARLVRQYATDPPFAALDLCAAPGGKSTLLADLLPDGALLISNEPMPKRAQVLNENMLKWTRMKVGEYPVRTLVTQNYPDDFGAFNACFDLLVTDVPCSGEGMFRKDEGAIRDWSPENVDLCWHRQRDILQSIWHTLRPGGLLIYSTCTFNHFEDEDNVRWICSELYGQLLEERHFLPGRDRGEGFYCAAIRKGGEPAGSVSTETIIQKVRKTLKLLPAAFEQTDGENVELCYEDALHYLRREAIRVPAPRGPVMLTYQGLVLGPGKGVGNRINNLYPEAWRIRTTYTTPFTLFTLPV